MEYRVLGPLEVWREGTKVALGGPRQRAVLALLLLNAGQVVSTDRLIDELWGDERPETVKAVLQGYVSNLRKAIGADVIVTRPPGYAVEPAQDQLDLQRFERLLGEGREALIGDDPATAAETLREALSLWRGPPLADFAYEPFAASPAVRLEELRLTAVEERIAADLGLGRHGELVGELEALVAEHPLRERLRGQLMLALYRSGRQAEALDAYREARRVLVDGLGIEPGQALQALETAILQHDPSLDLPGKVTVPEPERTSAAGGSRPRRSILVLAEDRQGLASLLTLAEPLAQKGARDLILTWLVSSGGDLGEANAYLQEQRAALVERGAPTRGAAFTSAEREDDAVRLASEQSVSLMLLDVTRELDPAGGSALDLGAVLAGAPCDVGLLVAGDRPIRFAPEWPLFVPFGGAEHEWAAAELGAWLAGAVGTTLVLLGTAADEEKGKRDASRLLATAALVVQQVADVVTEPRLVAPGPGAVVEAASEAGLLLLGLGDRWRHEGVGDARLSVARESPVPTLLVRGGVRPSGLAPRESLTRYTWTLAGAGG